MGWWAHGRWSPPRNRVSGEGAASVQAHTGLPSLQFRHISMLLRE